MTRLVVGAAAARNRLRMCMPYILVSLLLLLLLKVCTVNAASGNGSGTGTVDCPAGCTCVNSWSTSCTNMSRTPLPVQMHNGTRELTMSSGSLTRLDKQIFSTLTSLQLLCVTENEIAQLESDTFSANANLEHLDLSHNRIASLPHGVLKNLARLNMLDISYNQITQLDPDLFGRSLAPIQLILSGNAELTQLPTSFGWLYNIHTIELEHVPLAIGNNHLCPLAALSQRGPHNVTVQGLSSNAWTALQSMSKLCDGAKLTCLPGNLSNVGNASGGASGYFCSCPPGQVYDGIQCAEPSTSNCTDAAINCTAYPYCSVTNGTIGCRCDESESPTSACYTVNYPCGRFGLLTIDSNNYTCTCMPGKSIVNGSCMSEAPVRMTGGVLTTSSAITTSTQVAAVVPTTHTAVPAAMPSKAELRTAKSTTESAQRWRTLPLHDARSTPNNTRNANSSYANDNNSRVNDNSSHGNGNRTVGTASKKNGDGSGSSVADSFMSKSALSLLIGLTAVAYLLGFAMGMAIMVYLQKSSKDNFPAGRKSRSGVWTDPHLRHLNSGSEGSLEARRKSSMAMSYLLGSYPECRDLAATSPDFPPDISPYYLQSRNDVFFGPMEPNAAYELDATFQLRSADVVYDWATAAPGYAELEDAKAQAQAGDSCKPPPAGGAAAPAVAPLGTNITLMPVKTRTSLKSRMAANSRRSNPPASPPSRTVLTNLGEDGMPSVDVRTRRLPEEHPP